MVFPVVIHTSTSIRSIAEILHSIKDSREGITSSESWLRYLTAFNNTSSILPSYFVIRLTLVGRSSSSYLIDPQWARKFTITWTSVVVAGIFVSLPRLYRFVKQGRAFIGTFGVTESWKDTSYVLAEERQLQKRRTPWKPVINARRAWAVLSWTFSGFDISVGQSGRDFYSHSRNLTNHPL